MNKYLLIAVVLILGASNWGAYEFGASNHDLLAEATASDRVATNAVVQTGLVITERQTEQAAQAAVNEVSSYAVTDQATLVLALAVANGTAERLQRELQTTRDNLSGTGNYSSLAQRSASATKAAMVLSELYGSCQRRLTEISGFADRSYSSALTCSTSYNKVSKVFADGH